jgi:23S rRNA (adenine2503-C2)-methyltransferase
MTQKQIKGLTLKELMDICLMQDVPSFRAKQIYHWMYRHYVDDISKMNNIPESFRDYLKENYIVNTLEIENIQESECEDTKKILFKTHDGKLIESVSMIDNNLHTVCISSQVGCNVDCKFCATGLMGFKRNLTSGEILDQVIEINKLREKAITNIVYMGMGEPFLNYNEVMKSADIIHDHNGMNLGRGRITISTSGILPKIKKFIDEKRGYKLAISLNATDDDTRTKIIPINKKWNIQMLMDALEKYPVDKKNMVMLEYVLLKGINDSKKDAEKLASYANHLRCKVNVIPFNDIGNEYKRPDEDVINEFIGVLHKNQKHYQTLVRWSKGVDIDAACGQLSTNTS